MEQSSRVPQSVHPSRVAIPAGPIPDDGPVSMRGAALSSRGSRGTAVTSMPPSHLVARMPANHGSPYRVPGNRSAEGPSWDVTLERERRAASVSLSDEELAVGVVIGRSTSCLDQGLQAVLDTHISRGHLLLLHHHDAYEVFDLCSLNGTWERGKAVKRRRLGAERATLQLAGGAPVVLHWHGRDRAG